MRGQLDRIAVDGDAPGAGIEPDRPAIELALGVTGRPAKERPHPGQDFFQMKGLGDVIVGARVEALNLVAPAVARGQHQHRHGAAGPPPGLENRNAVHFRQSDIEDDGVIGLGFAEIMTFLAVESAVDHIAGVGQGRCELPVQVGIVLDDEETQGKILNLAAAGKSSGTGIDGHVGHFAIPRKQCQQVDKTILPLAELRSDHLALVSRGPHAWRTASGTTLPLACTAWRCSRVRQDETSAASAIRCGTKIRAMAIRINRHHRHIAILPAIAANMRRSIRKAGKGREIPQRRSRRAPGIDRSLLVRMAERDAAEQHHGVGQIEEG